MKQETHLYVKIVVCELCEGLQIVAFVRTMIFVVKFVKTVTFVKSAAVREDVDGGCFETASINMHCPSITHSRNLKITSPKTKPNFTKP